MCKDNEDRNFCRDCRWRVWHLIDPHECSHPDHVANYGSGRKCQCEDKNKHALCERFEARGEVKV